MRSEIVMQLREVIDEVILAFYFNFINLHNKDILIEKKSESLPYYVLSARLVCKCININDNIRIRINVNGKQNRTLLT